MEIVQKLGRMPIVLVVPALAILLSVVGLPLFQLFLDSFNAPEFSITNYQAFFGKSGWPVLIQTITISLVVTAICLIVGYPLAYLIMSTSKRLRVILIVLIVLPWLTSALVRTYAWTVILGDHGVINSLLLDLGVISSPLSLIYNRFGAYVGMVHIMLPTMILPLLSVMNGIDKSLMEAARSMGARPFEAFWRIFVPLSLPGVRSGSLLVFVVCLGFYITPQALGGLREIMLATYIAETFRSTSNLPAIATSAFILLALAMLVLSIFGLDLSGGKASDASIVRTTWLNRINPLRRVADKATNHHRSKRWTAELYQSARPSVWARIVGGLYVVLAMAFLQFPGLVIVVMSFSAGAFLEFPPAGFSLKWYYVLLGDAGWMDAFLTSLKLGVAVAILSTITGTLAAYGIDRTSPRLRNILTMAIVTPITAPVIVMGVAAYFGLLHLGLIGSTIGVVLAHSGGAIALVVVTVSATFANFDKQLERAALSMRADPLRTFVRVTLPLIRPGIIGGAMFAFISSFDEVIVTSLVGGFSVYTLPLKMLENLKQQIDPTLAAVGSLLTLMPLLWLVALYLTWWRKRLTSQTSSLKEA